MDVAIINSDEDEGVHTINIGNKATIETTYAMDVTNWVRQITKLYSTKNKKKQTLIIGLVPDRSIHYANGLIDDFYYRRNRIKPADYPYELIQLCIGSHCLLYELPQYDPPAKALRDLLSSDRTVVVGIGMESVKKILDKYNKLSILKVVDLKVLAEKEKGLGKCNSLDKLSKVVLGEEWGGVVRPKSMEWWSDELGRLTNDKIMFGTLDSFLAYEIGVKLLKDVQVAE